MVNEQGDGFGQVTHNGVGFFEEPMGNARVFCCPQSQLGNFNRALGSPSRKQCNDPEFIGI